MKKKLLLPLLFSTFFLLITSCQAKENLPPTTSNSETQSTMTSHQNPLQTTPSSNTSSEESSVYSLTDELEENTLEQYEEDMNDLDDEETDFSSPNDDFDDEGSKDNDSNFGRDLENINENQ